MLDRELGTGRLKIKVSRVAMRHQIQHKIRPGREKKVTQWALTVMYINASRIWSLPDSKRNGRKEQSNHCYCIIIMTSQPLYLQSCNVSVIFLGVACM